MKIIMNFRSQNDHTHPALFPAKPKALSKLEIQPALVQTKGY